MKSYAVAAIAFCACAGAAWADDNAHGVDADRDGRITRAEAQAARQAAFARIDADGDGYISAQEREAAAAAQRRRGWGRVDADNDGRISRDEFLNQPMRLFDRFDRDGDGVLDASEVEAMRNAAQARRP